MKEQFKVKCLLKLFQLKMDSFNGGKRGYSVNEIVGINFLDFSQSHNQIVGELASSCRLVRA